MHPLGRFGQSSCPFHIRAVEQMDIPCDIVKSPERIRLEATDCSLWIAKLLNPI